MAAFSSSHETTNDSSDLALQGKQTEETQAKAAISEHRCITIEDVRKQEVEAGTQSGDSAVISGSDETNDDAKYDGMSIEEYFQSEEDNGATQEEMSIECTELYASCAHWCCQAGTVPQTEPQSWGTFVEAEPKPAGFW